MAKALLHFFMDQKKGIRVSTNIGSGVAETEFSVVRFKGNQEETDSIYAGIHHIQSQDIVEMCYWISTLPSDLNLNRLEVMARCQGFGPYQVIRNFS